MKATKAITPAFLFSLFASGAFAQSALDESRVIEAALKDHFDVALPYVDRWVVGSSTEPLQPGAAEAGFDASREDYLRRNGHSVSLSGLALPERCSVADLSVYSHSGSFDWKAFGGRYALDETYTARVARPGFSDDSHAVVRVDVWNSAKLGPLTTAIYLAKSEGSWQVVSAISPAFR